MRRVKVFDGFKTRDERESCFPASSCGEGRNAVKNGTKDVPGGAGEGEI